jgi:hypothetical protein
MRGGSKPTVQNRTETRANISADVITYVLIDVQRSIPPVDVSGEQIAEVPKKNIRGSPYESLLEALGTPD